MSPEEGASQWKQYIQPLGNEGYTLISPACTNGASGIKWMQEFFRACSDCQVDATALHWYGTNAQDMINYLVEFHETFGKPIWVTEFACTSFSNQGSCGNAFEFLKTVKSFMDNTEWVKAYFAFGTVNFSSQSTNRMLTTSRRHA